MKQQLKFLNSHCSIVHSHYSIVCLIIKMSKIVENSSSSKEKEINRVVSPFNKDYKNIIFPQEGPNF